MCTPHTRVLTASSLSQRCQGLIGVGQTETESAVRRDHSPVLISSDSALLTPPHTSLPPDTTPKPGAAMKYGSQIAGGSLKQDSGTLIHCARRQQVACAQSSHANACRTHGARSSRAPCMWRYASKQWIGLPRFGGSHHPQRWSRTMEIWQ